MPSFVTSAALLASVTLSMAAPAQHHGRTFRVNQVEGRRIHKNGPLALMKAYSKYNKPMPAGLKEAAAANAQQGSVAANPQQYDSEYLCPVTLGGSQVNLDFDTGSADLWAFADVTPSSESKGHNLYDTSSGSQLQGYTWDISYADHTGASGTVYADTVVIGGVTATSQAVEAATSVSSQFTQDTANDGLVGLAFSGGNTVSPNQQQTFFDTVKGSLAQPLFTVDLKHQQAGSYDFGYIDSAKYTGDINYVNVDNSQNFWGLSVGGYSAGSAATSGSAGAAIADTGTTLILLPDSVCQSYYSNVSGAAYSNKNKGYSFACNTQMPDFNLEIGGVTYTVPGSYMNWAPNDDGTCFGGLQRSNDGGILGDVFLKTVFVVFDQTNGADNARLGFAKQS